MEVNQAFTVNFELIHLVPLRLQLPQCFQHTLVFDDSGNDVVLSRVRLRELLHLAFDGEIVGFGCTAGENDFFWLSVYQCGYLLP